MNIHEKVSDYFADIIHEATSGYPNFNFADDSAGAVGIIPSYSANTLKKYIDGSCQKEYIVAVIVTHIYSVGNDTTNIDAMELCQTLMSLIDRNEEHKIYPVLDGCEVELVENLMNIPTVQNVNDNDTAKYMFQARIVYKELANGKY